jgi:hypothetical protein
MKIQFRQFLRRHSKLVVLVGGVTLLVGIFSASTLVLAGSQQAQPTQQGQGQGQGQQKQSEESIVAFSGIPDFGNTTFGQNLPSGQSSIWTVSGTGATSNPNSACVWGGTCQLLRASCFNCVTNPASFSASTISTFLLANGTISLDTLVSTQSGTTINPANFAAAGLANGTDQNNAIEIVGFESVYLQNNPHLTCRTVSGGVSTDTDVPLPTLATGSLYQYGIVARSNIVKFYLNGALVATHTTNIPHTPLNALFALATPGGSTGVDLFISTTNFRQTLTQ